MRGSNDCLCIFCLDFQLYISDIIVLDAVCCGIKFNFSVKSGLCLIKHAEQAVCLGKVSGKANLQQVYWNPEYV